MRKLVLLAAAAAGAFWLMREGRDLVAEWDHAIAATWPGFDLGAPLGPWEDKTRRFEGGSIHHA